MWEKVKMPIATKENLKRVDEITESEAYLHGQIKALSMLANQIRLECKRKRWDFEAAAIHAMQEALKQSWYNRAWGEK